MGGCRKARAVGSFRALARQCGMFAERRDRDRCRTGGRAGQRMRDYAARPPDISMMEATDFGNLHDRADLRSVDRAPVWRILVEREVGARAVIVREVTDQDAAHMVFAKDEDVIPDTRAGSSR